MPATPTEVYLAGFEARCRTVHHHPLIGRPGVHGVDATASDGHLRLVVVDDRAYDVVARSLPRARTGTVTVFSSAPRCADLLAHHPAWAPGAATAMACPDLSAAFALPLPPGLRPVPVRRTAGDAVGVPLEQAVALVVADDPSGSAGAGRSLVEHLASMPASTRLTAAVDGAGVVRATSGYGVFEGHAHVIFVNTDRAWQGRGVGTAMTAAALLAARTDGARQAYLDASSSGRGVYERLGFEVVAAATRFLRTA